MGSVQDIYITSGKHQGKVIENVSLRRRREPQTIFTMGTPMPIAHKKIERPIEVTFESEEDIELFEEFDIMSHKTKSANTTEHDITIKSNVVMLKTNGKGDRTWLYTAHAKDINSVLSKQTEDNEDYLKILYSGSGF